MVIRTKTGGTIGSLPTSSRFVPGTKIGAKPGTEFKDISGKVITTSRGGGGGGGSSSSSSSSSSNLLAQQQSIAQEKLIQQQLEQARKVAEEKRIATEKSIQSRTLVGQTSQPNVVSAVSSPGGVYTGFEEQKPFGLKVKEAGGSAKAFLRGEGSFSNIFSPFDPKPNLSPTISPQPLFISGGSGTIIQGFEGFGSGRSGLTAGEYKLKTGRQAGEFPEYITVSGKEERIGGSLGVPTTSVKSSIVERERKFLQSQIDAGTINFGNLEGADFQKAAGDVLKARTQKDFLKLDITRPTGNPFAPVPLISGGAELGAITLASTTPIGGAFVGASLIGRGEKNVITGFTNKDLTRGERVLSVGAGTLDIGFGLGIGGFATTQAKGGLLSRQAIREAEMDLGKVTFEPLTGEVLGKTPSSELIRMRTLRQVGSSKQKVDLIAPIFKVGENKLSITGGRAFSKTKIYDPITDSFVTSSEKFSLGSFKPLDIGRGAQVRTKTKFGTNVYTTPELQSLVTVSGKGFIKRQGKDSFNVVDILSTSQKGKGGFSVLGIILKRVKVDLGTKLFGAKIGGTKLKGDFTSGGFIKDPPINKIDTSGLTMFSKSGKKTPFSTNFGSTGQAQIQQQVYKPLILTRGESSAGAGATLKLTREIKPSVSLASPNLNLVGIPRMVGGSGLTQSQLPKGSSSFEMTTPLIRPGQSFDIQVSEKDSFKTDFKPLTSLKSFSGLGSKSLSTSLTSTNVNQAFGTKQLQSPLLGTKTKQPTKQLFDTSFFTPMISTPTQGVRSSGDPFRFRGFNLDFPSLSGFGAPPRRSRTTRSTARLAPSFTGIVLDIKGLPTFKEVERNPFAIRGVGSVKSKKKKKK